MAVAWEPHNLVVGLQIDESIRSSQEDDTEDMVPLTRNMDIQFVPKGGAASPSDNATTLVKHDPTPWANYWNREVCVEKRTRQSQDDYFLSCHHHAPIIYTPKYKLAYLKTPKAASTAFWYFFKKTFPDSKEMIGAHNLPENVFVFTFVRQPFEHKLSAFAEVDLKQGSHIPDHITNQTTFQHVLFKRNHGRERYLAFLDDVWHRRFDLMDVRKPSHAANQLGGPLCTVSVKFIGHLERLTADWDQIQEEAGLPYAVRTTALPVVHADTSAVHIRYAYDEAVPMNELIKEKVCEIYRSEFACLGYTAPPVCKKFGLP